MVFTDRFEGSVTRTYKITICEFHRQSVLRFYRRSQRSNASLTRHGSILPRLCNSSYPWSVPNPPRLHLSKSYVRRFSNGPPRIVPENHRSIKITLSAHQKPPKTMVRTCVLVASLNKTIIDTKILLPILLFRDPTYLWDLV